MTSKCVAVALKPDWGFQLNEISLAIQWGVRAKFWTHCHFEVFNKYESTLEDILFHHSSFVFLRSQIWKIGANKLRKASAQQFAMRVYRTLLLVMSFRHFVHSRRYEQWQQPRSRAQVTPAFLFSAGLLFALLQFSSVHWAAAVRWAVEPR